MSAPNPGSWSLWRAQVGAILRLEVKKNFLARRGLWIYLVALAPAALWWVHASLNLRDGRHCDLGRDSLIFATMFQFFYLRLAVFFGCVCVFMKLFRGEMLEKSLHYYLLAPVRREVLLVGKYLAGVIATSIVFCTGTVLALAGLLGLSAVRDRAVSFWRRRLGPRAGLRRHGRAGMRGLRRRVSPDEFSLPQPHHSDGAGLVWESMNPFLPTLLKKLSVIFYLQSLCPLPVPAQGDFAFLAVLTEPTPAYLAVPGLLLVTAAGLLIAARQVRKLEINYGAD